MSAEKVRILLMKDGWTKTQGTTEWSSIVGDGVRSTYEKNGKKVQLGLNVKGYPPSLIYPRPKAVTKLKSLSWIYDRYSLDGEMIELINSMSDEDILKELNSDEPFKDYELYSEVKEQEAMKRI